MSDSRMKGIAKRRVGRRGPAKAGVRAAKKLTQYMDGRQIQVRSPQKRAQVIAA